MSHVRCKSLPELFIIKTLDRYYKQKGHSKSVNAFYFLRTGKEVGAIFHPFCKHKSALIKYKPRTPYLEPILYCPRCHKYGSKQNDKLKWSRKLPTITNYIYVSNKRGVNNGVQ